MFERKHDHMHYSPQAGAHCAPVCSRRALRTCALRGSGLPHLPICDSLPVKEHHHSCLKADCGVGMLVVRTHKTDMHTCTCALRQGDTSLGSGGRGAGGLYCATDMVAVGAHTPRVLPEYCVKRGGTQAQNFGPWSPQVSFRGQ